ncbi:hypothetical protein AnigIFM63309_003759 [Aspergillus niger]|nr:hypothetical protein AnigIFM63309_003759 [Aspergillus niger]
MGPSPKGKEMIVIVSVLVGLTCLSMTLRFVARVKRRTGFGVDDCLCFVAVVLMLGMLIELILWCSIGGNGYHISDLDTRTIELFYQIFLSSQFTYFVLTPLIKISFICFYRRLFTTKHFLRFTLALNILIAAWSSGIFLACALQCRPLRAYWDINVKGRCFSATTYIIVNQAFNVVMDFVILAVPVPMIWRLHRSWQDKLALNAVFALGGLYHLRRHSMDSYRAIRRASGFLSPNHPRNVSTMYIGGSEATDKVQFRAFFDWHNFVW